MISKVYNKTISIKELKEINSSSYRDANRVNRSLLYLNLHNLILLNEDNTWIITPFGKAFLYELVQRNPQTTSS